MVLCASCAHVLTCSQVIASAKDPRVVAYVREARQPALDGILVAERAQTETLSRADRLRLDVRGALPLPHS